MHPGALPLCFGLETRALPADAERVDYRVPLDAHDASSSRDADRHRVRAEAVSYVLRPDDVFNRTSSDFGEPAAVGTRDHESCVAANDPLAGSSTTREDVRNLELVHPYRVGAAPAHRAVAVGGRYVADERSGGGSSASSRTMAERHRESSRLKSSSVGTAPPERLVASSSMLLQIASAETTKLVDEATAGEVALLLRAGAAPSFPAHAAAASGTDPSLRDARGERSDTPSRRYDHARACSQGDRGRPSTR